MDFNIIIEKCDKLKGKLKQKYINLTIEDLLSIEGGKIDMSERIYQKLKTTWLRLCGIILL
jgi:hypothetical protein